MIFVIPRRKYLLEIFALHFLVKVPLGMFFCFGLNYLSKERGIFQFHAYLIINISYWQLQNPAKAERIERLVLSDRRTGIG